MLSVPALWRTLIESLVRKVWLQEAREVARGCLTWGQDLEVHAVQLLRALPFPLGPQRRGSWFSIQQTDLVKWEEMPRARRGAWLYPPQVGRGIAFSFSRGIVGLRECRAGKVFSLLPSSFGSHLFLPSVPPPATSICPSSMRSTAVAGCWADSRKQEDSCLPQIYLLRTGRWGWAGSYEWVDSGSHAAGCYAVEMKQGQVVVWRG